LRTNQVRQARRAPLVADFTAMLLLPLKVELAGRWLLSVQMCVRQKDRDPVGPRPVGAKPEPARGGMMLALSLEATLTNRARGCC
jgi:hypothetical protein